MLTFQRKIRKVLLEYKVSCVTLKPYLNTCINSYTPKIYTFNIIHCQVVHEEQTWDFSYASSFFLKKVFLLIFLFYKQNLDSRGKKGEEI